MAEWRRISLRIPEEFAEELDKEIDLRKKTAWPSRFTISDWFLEAAKNKISSEASKSAEVPK